MRGRYVRRVRVLGMQRREWNAGTAGVPRRARWAVMAAFCAVPCVGLSGDGFPVVMAGAQPCVRLADLARTYGLRASSPQPERLDLLSPFHAMRFEEGNRRVSLMDVVLWLQYPASRVRGRWVIHRADAENLIDPILRPYRHLRGRGAAVVVLDAGHGGRDGGAESPYAPIVEKDVALNIARRVREYLPVGDLVVRLTREDDEFVELDERSRRAAQWGADIFISIHCNSGPDPAATGIETYILSKAGLGSTHDTRPVPVVPARMFPGNHHDAASAVLGFNLQRQLIRETNAQDRGLRHARFAVLRGAPCAATLVECGFLSNREDARRLADPGYQDRLACGIARGIMDYVGAVRKAEVMLP